LVRDILSFLGGWTLIFMEVSRPDIRESVLVLAGSVIGVPGLAVGATSIAEAVARRRNGIDDSSPPSVASASSQSSSSS
jgi:hypothetical protein